MTAQPSAKALPKSSLAPSEATSKSFNLSSRSTGLLQAYRFTGEHPARLQLRPPLHPPPTRPPPYQRERTSTTMPPKRAPSSVPATNSKSAQARIQESGGSAGRALRDTYDALTAKENRSVVQAVGVFGVSSDVLFLRGSKGRIGRIGTERGGEEEKRGKRMLRTPILQHEV